MLITNLSRVMRKPALFICENKDADQLRGNHEADQRLCLRYKNSTIPLLSKSEISRLYPSSVAVQPGLCLTRSETRTFFSHDAAHLLFLPLSLPDCIHLFLEWLMKHYKNLHIQQNCCH